MVVSKALVKIAELEMPELERQEEQMLDRQNTLLRAPTDIGEGEENAYPPKLDPEETMERPILSLPKRLLAMAMTSIVKRPEKRKAFVSPSPLPPRSFRSSVFCSFCSRCPSTDNFSSKAADSNDKSDGKKREGRKRIATGNGMTEEEEQRKRPTPKRRRIGSRIGPRRKRRGQRHNGRDTERQRAETEQKQLFASHGDAAPLKMARIYVPKRAESTSEDKGLPILTKGRSMALTAAPLLPFVSNWSPIGPGSLRRSVRNSREFSVCYDAICHRKEPNVTIRIGDCVRINSADSADDLFVGRVLAIRPEGHALQLTLLWFYAPRQLPSVPHTFEFDPHELFASKHLDSVNADSVDALIHVLTFAEYCRYRAKVASNRQSNGRTVPKKETPFRCLCPPIASDYPRRDFLPPIGTPSDAVFFCRGVFSLSKKRVVSFGSVESANSSRGLKALKVPKKGGSAGQ